MDMRTCSWHVIDAFLAFIQLPARRTCARLFSHGMQVTQGPQTEDLGRLLPIHPVIHMQGHHVEKIISGSDPGRAGVQRFGHRSRL